MWTGAPYAHGDEDDARWQWCHSPITYIELATWSNKSKTLRKTIICMNKCHYHYVSCSNREMSHWHQSNFLLKEYVVRLINQMYKKYFGWVSLLVFRVKDLCIHSPASLTRKICSKLAEIPGYFCRQIYPQFLLGDFLTVTKSASRFPPPVSVGRLSDSHQICWQIYPPISAGRFSDSY